MCLMNDNEHLNWVLCKMTLEDIAVMMPAQYSRESGNTNNRHYRFEKSRFKSKFRTILQRKKCIN